MLLAWCVCSVRTAGHRATTTVEKKRRIRGWREKRKKEDVIGCRRERPGASLVDDTIRWVLSTVCSTVGGTLLPKHKGDTLIQ